MQRLFQKKSRKGRMGLFILALPFLIVYFLLFARPLGKETRIQSEWLINLDNPEKDGQGMVAASDKDRIYPFSMGQEPGDYFGYFRGDGKPVLVKKIAEEGKIPYRVTISRQGFIYYPLTYSDLVFYDRTGAQKRIYHKTGPGFPFLSRDGNRFFMIKTDLSGLKELDNNGSVLWHADVPSWISSISYNRKNIICGSGDGTVSLFDTEGNLLSSFSLQKSDIDCIYGTALSAENDVFAGISGAGPQYLFVGKINGQEKPLSELIRLDSDFRREVRMRFSHDGSLLFFEGNRAINIYNLRSKRLTTISLPGDVRALAYADSTNTLTVVGGQNNVYEIMVVKPENTVLFKDYFSGQKIFLYTEDRRIFLGVDHQLIRLDVLEE